jgi:hypothetical protein
MDRVACVAAADRQMITKRGARKVQQVTRSEVHNLIDSFSLGFKHELIISNSSPKLVGASSACERVITQAAEPAGRQWPGVRRSDARSMGLSKRRRNRLLTARKAHAG